MSHLTETSTEFHFSFISNDSYMCFLSFDQLSKIINNKEIIILDINNRKQIYYDTNGFSVTKILHLIGLERICSTNLINNKNLPGKKYTTADYVEQLIKNFNNDNDDTTKRKINDLYESNEFSFDGQIMYDYETVLHGFTYDKITNIVKISVSC